MRLKGVIVGAGLGFGAAAMIPAVLRARFTSDVTALNAGDHRPLLDAYSDDFVLHFHDGDHRWRGQWRGRDGMDRFLRNFTAAKIQGEIKAVAASGPPWAMTIWARFDDHADGPEGERLYENRTVLVLRTRWGKVVEQEDFYADTGRLTDFDRRLSELGVPAVPPPSPGG
jgi:ketosteroid isomerase-like protein